MGILQQRCNNELGRMGKPDLKVLVLRSHIRLGHRWLGYQMLRRVPMRIWEQGDEPIGLSSGSQSHLGREQWQVRTEQEGYQ